MLRLLDLFSGAGGAGMGYYRAGFDVTGIDNVQQLRYPFQFVHADALDYVRRHGHEYDVIHASPPCQRYSRMSRCRVGLAGAYPDLIAETRAVLVNLGKPFVIENVEGAPLINPITLCGVMFSLDIYRHRLFEWHGFDLSAPPHPRHTVPTSKAGHWIPGTFVSVAGNCAPIQRCREAMGIGWMSRNQLTEAIPPAYTEFVGNQLFAQMGALRRAA